MDDALREKCLDTGLFDYENSVALAEKLKAAQAAVIEVSKAIDLCKIETSEEEDGTITQTIILFTELEKRNRVALNFHRNKFANQVEAKPCTQDNNPNGQPDESS